MTFRACLLFCLAPALMLAGCREAESGPIVVSAIGNAPVLVNPNRTLLDPPSELLTTAVAQGLVRFDSAGQIEPALAQSWTVSDDGTGYIFRIARTTWPDGRPVTTDQVAARLTAAASRASRNSLKPLLGSIAEVVRMTERVIEIRLKSPRPNFLQLLAQPEMGIIRAGAGTGPMVATPVQDGSILLAPRPDDEEEAASPALPRIVLRGERAAMAVARFDAGLAALVTGGTFADLTVARAAEPPAAALRFDPVNGLLGLEVASRTGPATDPELRRALSMAIDRGALAASLGVPGLATRETLLPPGLEEQPAPASPEWSALPPAARLQTARALIQGRTDAPVSIRVAMPEGPGARLLFAHLRRDWRAIGVDATAVAAGERADLRLVDEVAPALLASWYLRHFTCDASIVCSPEADTAMEAARMAPDPVQRRDSLAAADRLLTDLAAFIPIAAPVRWSLVSPRLTGWQPNPFGVRFVGSLVAPPR